MAVVHRIACGALVVRNDKILLVHHFRPGIHDLWIAPGGGLEPDESLSNAAERETFEETGISIAIVKLAYIEQLSRADQSSVKFWFLAKPIGGSLNIAANPATDESIVEANWFACDALPDGAVFPEPIATQFWDDLAAGFAAPIILPPRTARF
ncbi:NUDIX hydrolase [Devosia rhodophyticola]|uniref:NUDIX hydrolase n=1 Tax=Devosia rhodophyticola TaxID=3026423 RepID=A0ABY7Z170_9HYPH|nr:NUDIX hydrolase [Devosia rhodophyticola]WDR07334.1 NUDIX hydrolase [Devosia rhodophyticola]